MLNFVKKIFKQAKYLFCNVYIICKWKIGVLFVGSNDINHTSYRNNDGYINPNFKAGEVKTETISPQTKVIYSTKPDEFLYIMSKCE